MSCSLPHYDLWASLQYPILSKAFTLHLQYSGTQKLKMKYTQVYMMSMEKDRVQNWNGIVLRNSYMSFVLN